MEEVQPPEEEEVVVSNTMLNMKDEYQNQEQDRRLVELENHWSVLNDEFGKIKDGLQVVKTNQEWIMKFFWVIASTTMATLVSSVLMLILKI